MANKIYHYYVEGECEKKLINELKRLNNNKLVSGKVEVFNVITKKIPKARLLSLKKNTTVILVYDTDKEVTEFLDENVRMLKTSKFNVIHIQSIKNFEDEIVFSTNIKKIQELFNTEGISDFKKRFLAHQDIMIKLKSVDFNYLKLWSRVSSDKFFSKYSCEKDLKVIKL